MKNQINSQTVPGELSAALLIKDYPLNQMLMQL